MYSNCLILGGIIIVILLGDYCVRMVLFREVYRQTFLDNCIQTFFLRRFIVRLLGDNCIRIVLFREIYHWTLLWDNCIQIVLGRYVVGLLGDTCIRIISKGGISSDI